MYQVYSKNCSKPKHLVIKYHYNLKFNNNKKIAIYQKFYLKVKIIFLD